MKVNVTCGTCQQVNYGCATAPYIYTQSTAQRSTAQHSTAQHSTAQHSTAQHSTHCTILSIQHMYAQLYLTVATAVWGAVRLACECMMSYVVESGSRKGAGGWRYGSDWCNQEAYETPGTPSHIRYSTSIANSQALLLFPSQSPLAPSSQCLLSNTCTFGCCQGFEQSPLYSPLSKLAAEIVQLGFNLRHGHLAQSCIGQKLMHAIILFMSLLLTAHCSLLTAHCSLLTAYCFGSPGPGLSDLWPSPWYRWVFDVSYRF